MRCAAERVEIERRLAPRGLRGGHEQAAHAKQVVGGAHGRHHRRDDSRPHGREHRFGAGVMRVPHPGEWLSDNGPPYTANETRAFGASLGFLVCPTPAYSPESNGMAESFVKTFKRDYVYLHKIETAGRRWPSSEAGLTTTTRSTRTAARRCSRRASTSAAQPNAKRVRFERGNSTRPLTTP